MKIHSVLERLKEDEKLIPLDFFFARTLCLLANENKSVMEILLVFIHQAVRDGHIGVSLDYLNEKLVRSLDEKSSEGFSTDMWKYEIDRSLLFNGPESPLLYEEELVYLRKNRDYEESIAVFLQNLSRKEICLLSGMDRRDFDLFFKKTNNAVDWQKTAVFHALSNDLTILLGGPGTGKTYTLTAILYLYVKYAKNLNICLCAPTGKAAYRMNDSILEQSRRLRDSDGVDNWILDAISGIKAQTLHRLIRNRPLKKKNMKLDVSLLIIDEFSMVDTALMARLTDVLPEDIKVVIIGDNHQLASVEPGAILGELVSSGKANCFSRDFIRLYDVFFKEKVLQDSLGDEIPSCLFSKMIELKKNRRFAEDSSIAKVSGYVKEGTHDAAEKAVRLLKESGSDLFANHEIEWFFSNSSAGLEKILKKIYYPHIKKRYLSKDGNPSFHLSELEGIIALTALRKGPWGQEGVNRVLMDLLSCEDELIELKKDGSLYELQPVMVTKNDYQLNLFNGDMGVVVKGENDRLKVCFYQVKKDKKEFVLFEPNLLPRLETVYAMTIHKSQGSEYEEVIIILPARMNPVLTKELLYTALTRAKKKVYIVSSEAVLREMMIKKAECFAGLKERLRT